MRNAIAIWLFVVIVVVSTRMEAQQSQVPTPGKPAVSKVQAKKTLSKLSKKTKEGSAESTEGIEPKQGDASGDDSAGRRSPFTLHADETSTHVGEGVKFTILFPANEENSGLTFTVDFGDSSQPRLVPADHPQFVHVFGATGVFEVRCTLLRVAGAMMAVVTHPPRDSLTVQVDSVILDAAPQTTEVGQKTVLRVQFKSVNNDARYRFWDTQGRLIADWQSDPEIEYSTNTTGTVGVHADVEYSTELNIRSVTRTIGRTIAFTAANVVVELIPSAEKIATGDTETFHVKTHVASSGMLYHFTFGDEVSIKGDRKVASTWTTNETIAHVYGTRGSYYASVEVSSGNQVWSSKKVMVQVSEAGSVPVWPKVIVWMLICAAVLAGVSAVYKVSRPPRVTFALVKDDPFTSARTTTPVTIGCQFTLITDLENGKSAISAPGGILVKRRRRNND